MRHELTWMLFMILPLVIVISRPVQEDVKYAGKIDVDDLTPTKSKDVPQGDNDEVISVSITSSIAVGRNTGKPQRNVEPINGFMAHESVTLTPVTAKLDSATKQHNATQSVKEISSELVGANIEFIKQLLSKKEARGTHHLEQVHPFQFQIKNFMANGTNEPVDHRIINENLQTKDNSEEIHEDIENIPLGRSVAMSPSSQNYIQGQTQSSERGQGPRLTTVSFNIVHDTPSTVTNYNDHSRPASQTFPDLSQIYNEPPKIYSQPAQIYSEPAKIYSEPAKIYSEPAKVYSEPAKIYSVPAKIYSEPAKFYSPAASLNLPPKDTPMPYPWEQTQMPTTIDTTDETTPASTTPVQPAEHDIIDHRAEKNYEVDEKDSVLTEGRMHGIQESPENCKDANCKVGYVVEGRQFRKYRVEERTSDGFIVGEYGVVRNEDGALRGVRYTADSAASPRLIYDALMRFLQL